MDVLYPTPMTDARLHSSTIAETNPAAWNSGTTYAIGNTVTFANRIYRALTANTNQQPNTQPTHWQNLYAANPPAWNSATSYGPGDVVLRTTTHRIYEALDHTTNHVPENNPAEWAVVGPTNTWAMFDNVLSTSTEATSTIEVVIRPGVFVTSLALLGVVGGTVTVVQKDAPGGTIRVYEWESGRTLATYTPGTENFVRGVLRGLVRERHSRDIGSDIPFRVARHQDGALILEDPATGRRINLWAFGPDNVKPFARLLGMPGMPGLQPG